MTIFRQFLGLLTWATVVSAQPKWERILPTFDATLAGRSGHVAIVNATNWMALGGSTDDQLYPNPVYFDLASDTIVGEGPNPNSTWQVNRAAAASLPDGTLYSFSGVTVGGQTQFGLRRYSPSLNIWTTMVRNPAYTQPDPPSRRFAAAAILSSCWLNPVTVKLEACFAMFSGLSATSSTPSTQQVWIAYDLFNASGFGWRVLSIPGSPVARWNVAAAASPDGSILYLIGGDTAAGPTNEVWALATQGFPDPSANEWTNIARSAGTAAYASSFNTAPITTVQRPRDGNRNGNINANSCWRNNVTLPSTRTDPWWVVDLARVQQIDQITICQPTMCCRGDMAGYQVYTSSANNSLPWSGTPPLNTQQVRTPAADISGQCVDIRTNNVGRYVWIRLPGALRTMTLCEVEVYQRNPMVFRQLSGTYSAGVGKPAFQTSRDNNQESTQFGGDPERCFDGITSGNAPDWCKTSNLNVITRDAFVAVDLLREHDISSITIWPRRDSPDQRRNSRMELYVGNSRDFRSNTRVWGPSDALCGACNVSSLTACTNAPPTNVPVTMNARGRFVFLRRVTTNDVLTANVIQMSEIAITARKLLNEPTPRSGAASTTWGGYFVLFGGTTAAGIRLNEVRLFDLINGIWLPPVKVLGSPPAPRMWGTLSALPGSGMGNGWGVPSNRLLLFGGQGQTDSLADFSVLRYPQCTPLSDPAATDITCSQAGTICYITCNSAYSFSTNGANPVRCRADGTWAGVFPLCQSTLPSAPTIRGVSAGVAPGTAVVQWSAPAILGMATSFASYRIGVYNPAYTQQFSINGFTDSEKWSFKPGNTPQSGLYGFLSRSLYLDSCPNCDCNTRNQQCTVLTREFPSEFVNPASSWAVETYVTFLMTTRVPLDGQAAGLCIYDAQETLASTTNPGLCEMFLHIRRGGSGYAGLFNVGWEHNSQTFRSFQVSPTPGAFLRIERDFPNRRWRAGYKFKSTAEWSYFPYRPDNVFSRGVNGTDAEAFPPSAIRVGFIMKNFNNLLRSYAEISYFRVSPIDCADPGPTVEIAAPLGAANTNTANVLSTTLSGLDEGRTYRFTVQASTSAGWGPQAVSAVGSGEVTTVASIPPFINSSTLVEVAQGKPATASNVCSNCNSPPGNAVDGNPLTHFVSGNSALGGEYLQIDLGIQTAVKQIFLQNRADCCQQRMIGMDVFVSALGGTSYNEYPRCLNVPFNLSAPIQRNGTIPLPGPTALFNCSLVGRYVTIRAPMIADTAGSVTVGIVDGYMNMAEVRVFAANRCPGRRATNAQQVPGTTCSNARYGSVCTHTCNSGFVAVSGAGTSICNGESWSEPELICAPECPTLTIPQYGSDVAVQTLVFENFDQPLVNVSNWYAALQNRLVSLEPNSQNWNDKWYAVNDVLQGSSGLGCTDALFMAIAATKVRNWRGDFSLSARVRTDDRAGIFFGAQDRSNMYLLYMDEVVGNVVLDRVVAGTAFRITDATIRTGLRADTFYKIEINEISGVMIILLDGEELTRTADNTFTAGFAGAYVQTDGDVDDLTYSIPVSSCQGANENEFCDMECPLGLIAVGPTRRTCSVVNSTMMWMPLTSTDPLSCTLSPPAFLASTISVAENVIRGTNVGNPLVAIIDSPDYTVSWKIDATIPAAADGVFTIDTCSGQVKVRRAVINFELISSYILTVRAFVNEFASTAFTVRNVTVRIINVDEPPVLADSIVTLNENSALNTLVGNVPAWDPDNDTMAFVIDIDPSGGLFTIDTNTGAVQVASVTGLNYEGFPNEWDLVILVSQVSNPSLKISAKYTVTLVDVNDPPALLTPAVLLPIEYDAQVGMVAGTFGAFDEDAGSFASSFTYTLLSPSSGATQAECLITTAANIPSVDGTTQGLPLFTINTNTGDITVARLPNGVSAWAQIDPPFLAYNKLLRAEYHVCVRLDDTFSGTSYTKAVIGIVADTPSMPVITGVSPISGLSTAGGDVITVSGTGFGNPGQYASTMKVWYGTADGTIYYNVSLSNVTVVSSTQLTFIMQPGVGKDLIVHIDTTPTSSSVDLSNQVLSYQAPLVSSIVGNIAIPTTVDGRTLIFTGSNFGPLGTVLKFTYGPNLAGVTYSCMHQPSITNPDTIAECIPPEGAGTDMPWTITVGNQVVSSQPGAVSADLVSYIKPVITDVVNGTSLVDIYSLSTLGNEDIIIQGTNFGPAGTPITVQYGGSTGLVLNFVGCLSAAGAAAHTQITCKTVPGAGFGHAVSLTTGGVTVNTPWVGSNGGLRYKSPVVTSLVASPATLNGITEGGLTFAIEGTSFGPSNWIAAPVVTYGPVGAENRFTAANCRIATAVGSPVERIECETAPGCGSNYVVQASISQQFSNVYSASTITYAAPQVFTLSGTGSDDASTLGNEPVVITGKNYGPTVGSTSYTCPLVVSYLAPLENGPDALTNVSLTAVSCSVTVAHTEITCTTVEGAGRAFAWTVFVDGQRSVQPTTAYKAPYISLIRYAATGLPVTAANVDGNETLELVGDSFGPTNYAANNNALIQKVTYGPSGVEYEVARADWKLIDHTRLQIRTLPGTGSNLYFRVMVADQTSVSAPTAVFSYAPITIDRMVPATASTFSDPRNPTVITLYTRNLPLRDRRSRIGLSFGNKPYDLSLIPVIPSGDISIANAKNADGTLNVTFVLPKDGGGIALPVQLQVFPLGATVSSQVSSITPSSIFNYKPPRVDDVILTRARFSTGNGNESINDGPPCKFPANDPIWKCDDPSLNALEIVGADFTADPLTMDRQDGITRLIESLHLNDTYIGEIWRTSDIWLQSWSHTRIVLYTPRSEGTIRISLTSLAYGGTVALQQTTFSFKTRNPGISDVVGDIDNIPTTGGTTPIEIEIYNLQGASNLSVTIGGRFCNGLYKTDDTPITDVAAFITNNPQPWTIRVYAPPGQGLFQKVIVYRTISGKVEGSNTDFFVHYSPPNVQEIAVVVNNNIVSAFYPTDFAQANARVPTDGTGKIRLTGTNLGISPVLVIQGTTAGINGITLTPCAGTAGSHTCYEGFTPTGEGNGACPASGSTADYRMIIRVSEYENPLMRFGYNAPIVHRILSSTGSFPTRGGERITLIGINFGDKNPTCASDKVIEVSFGRPNDGGLFIPCTDVTRDPHYVINCTLPEGSGRLLTARVSVDGVTNDTYGVLSYNAPIITSIDTASSSWTLSNALVASPEIVSSIAMNDTIIIRGTNFGKYDNLHCAFFTWSYRRDTVSVHTCNNGEDFLGEGEVSKDYVVAWDHEQIELQIPPGLGFKDLELSIRGNTLGLPRTSKAVPKFQYAVPTLTGLFNNFDFTQQGKADTEGGDIMTLKGLNFGLPPRNTSDPSKRLTSEIFSPPLPLSDAATLPTAYVVIIFHRACITSGRTLTGALPDSLLPAWYGTVSLETCSQNILYLMNDTINFRSAPGIGSNRNVYVAVVDAQEPSATVISQPLQFSFQPPLITDFDPSIFYVNSIATPAFDIKGRYFGNEDLATVQQWSQNEILVSASVGGVACSTTKRRREGGKTIVACKADISSTLVGFRNVSITIAGQVGRKEATEAGALNFVCGFGFYGRINETCRRCPQQNPADPRFTGAVCYGYNNDEDIPVEERHTYPVPLKGWFNLNSSDAYTKAAGWKTGMMSECPGRARDGDRDVCIVPCDPPESCLGDNICAYGYTSKPPMWRCASCDRGFYKRAGECIKCPDSPAGLFIGFLVLVIFMCGVAFQLNKRQINIAVVSIGIDFFQVLAIFSQSRIKWPPVIKELFHVLSAFNLNIEIVAPECLIPDVNYKQKFWFIMILPLSIGAIFAINYGAILAYKAVILGQEKKRWHSHSPALISSLLILIYMLYLYLTRTIFDVFNCTPTMPDDGFTYLSVVFERCGVEGGTQMTLMGYAIAGLIVYTAGYPTFIGYTLWKNRETVMEDQLLRAKGVGNDLLSGPRTYNFRLTYGRSYFQFRPDNCLWILAIILRKFFIALTAVVFNKNASFQMAACLLVMFVAYAAQTHTKPYMSAGDFDDVLKQHVESSFTSALHARLRVNLSNIESRGKKKVRKNLLNFEGTVDRSAVLGILTSWLFNYNTVEEIMLFAAVIVCLMGIMYQANEVSTYYPESKDSVTAVVLAVIILAIIYFVTVFVTEIVILYNEANRTKQLSKMATSRTKSKGSSDDDNKRNSRGQGRLVDDSGDINTGKLDTQMNPLFMSASGNASVGSGSNGVNDAILAQKTSPPQELWILFQQGYLDMQNQLQAAQNELANVKRRAQQAESDVRSPAVAEDNEERSGPRRKAQFAPRSSDAGSTSNPLKIGTTDAARNKSMASFSSMRKQSVRTTTSNE